MLDQNTFDRAEEIAEALHDQDALDTVLIGVIGEKLDPETEKLVFGLIHAQMHCRNRAAHAADAIIKGDAP